MVYYGSIIEAMPLLLPDEYDEDSTSSSTSTRRPCDCGSPQCNASACFNPFAADLQNHAGSSSSASNGSKDIITDQDMSGSFYEKVMMLYDDRKGGSASENVDPEDETKESAAVDRSGSSAEKKTLESGFGLPDILEADEEDDEGSNGEGSWEQNCFCSLKDEKNRLLQKYIEHFQREIHYTKHLQQLLAQCEPTRSRNVGTMFNSTCCPGPVAPSGRTPALNRRIDQSAVEFLDEKSKSYKPQVKKPSEDSRFIIVKYPKTGEFYTPSIRNRRATPAPVRRHPKPPGSNNTSRGPAGSTPSILKWTQAEANSIHDEDDEILPGDVPSEYDDISTEVQSTTFGEDDSSSYSSSLTLEESSVQTRDDFEAPGASKSSRAPGGKSDQPRQHVINIRICGHCPHPPSNNYIYKKCKPTFVKVLNDQSKQFAKRIINCMSAPGRGAPMACCQPPVMASNEYVCDHSCVNRAMPCRCMVPRSVPPPPQVPQVPQVQAQPPRSFPRTPAGPPASGLISEQIVQPVSTASGLSNPQLTRKSVGVDSPTIFEPFLQEKKLSKAKLLSFSLHSMATETEAWETYRPPMNTPVQGGLCTCRLKPNDFDPFCPLGPGYHTTYGGNRDHGQFVCSTSCEDGCNTLPAYSARCHGPRYCMDIQHPFRSFYPDHAVQVNSLELVRQSIYPIPESPRQSFKEMEEVQLPSKMSYTPSRHTLTSIPRYTLVTSPPRPVRRPTVHNIKVERSKSILNVEEDLEAAPSPPEKGGDSTHRRTTAMTRSEEDEVRKFPAYSSLANAHDNSSLKHGSQAFAGDSNRESRRVSLRYDFPVLGKLDNLTNQSMMRSSDSVEERIRNLRQNLEKQNDISSETGSQRSQSTLQSSMRERGLSITEDLENKQPRIHRSFGTISSTGRKNSARRFTN